MTKCFVGDGSPFSGESLWRAELIGELVVRFVDGARSASLDFGVFATSHRGLVPRLANQRA